VVIEKQGRVFTAGACDIGFGHPDAKTRRANPALLRKALDAITTEKHVQLRTQSHLLRDSE